jgi:transcriptional regulator GlxA family with amidase domain
MLARRQAVRRAERVVRAHPDQALPVATLSRLVGLSERGLRNAFYGVHGVSPKRWMVGARLERVRLALTSAGSETVTVTGIATGCGFYDLGRFAATYRETFGERPSETLRGARQKGSH